MMRSRVISTLRLRSLLVIIMERGNSWPPYSMAYSLTSAVNGHGDISISRTQATTLTNTEQGRIVRYVSAIALEQIERGRYTRNSEHICRRDLTFARRKLKCGKRIKRIGL